MSNQNYLSIYAKSFNWAGFFYQKKFTLNAQLYMIFVEWQTILQIVMSQLI